MKKKEIFINRKEESIEEFAEKHMTFIVAIVTFYIGFLVMFSIMLYIIHTPSFFK